MLDQRQVRENPDLISDELQRRGLNGALKPLQLIAQQQRNLEEQRSKLQAEGNLIGKEVGQLIKSGIEPSSDQITQLRFRGNEIKKKVGFEESIMSKKGDRKLKFFNLGKNNDWRKLLDKSTVLNIERIFEVTMRELNY